jgi:hypothetical protein
MQEHRRRGSGAEGQAQRVRRRVTGKMGAAAQRRRLGRCLAVTPARALLLQLCCCLPASVTAPHALSHVHTQPALLAQNARA